MGDIVATIQGEQDEVIRAPMQGVLVVQGGPGTGKTAVALHRAAYLLYTYRFPLERQGVLVVGPNPVFLRYIGHVLPSLGETGVDLSTISRLVPDAAVRAVDSAEVAAVKGDPRMAQVIAGQFVTVSVHCATKLSSATARSTCDLRQQTPKRLLATLAAVGGPHNTRRKRLERLVAQRLYERYTGAVDRQRQLDPSAAEIDLQRFTDSLKEVDGFGEMLDRMWPRLLPTELVHDLFGAQPLIDLATKGILSKEEAALLFRQRSASLEEIPWTDGDMALIDEARVYARCLQTPW